MCASAFCGAITDLAFDLEGYLWQIINCLFTASYSLYLRGVMDKVRAASSHLAVIYYKTPRALYMHMRYDSELLHAEYRAGWHRYICDRSVDVTSLDSLFVKSDVQDLEGPLQAH